MNGECYECYVCRYGSIFKDYVVCCDFCSVYVCSRCFKCQKNNTDSVDWSDERLNKDYGTINKGFCPSCKEIEKNKYVYAVTLVMSEYIYNSEVYVFRTEEEAKTKLIEILTKYHEDFTDENRTFEGDDILKYFSDSVPRFGMYFSMKKLELM